MSDRSMASGSSPEIKNIVLVGRAGNGKSATGNSLVGKKIFRSEIQATGVTMTCQSFRAVIPNHYIINVIDTPGLFDLITKPDVISKEIVRCLALAEEGLHAVVLVLTVKGRITKEEEDSLCTLQFLFGSKILDYLIVVFTGGDLLDPDGQTLDNYLYNCPDFLKNIFKLCGDRKVLFDNITTDQEKKDKQINQLLAHVAAIERINNRKPFTETMHRQIQVENERFRRAEEEAYKAKYLAKAIEQEKMRLKEEHDRNMIEMAKMVEVAIKKAWRTHEMWMNAMSKQDTRTCNIM